MQKFSRLTQCFSHPELRELHDTPPPKKDYEVAAFLKSQLIWEVIAWCLWILKRSLMGRNAVSCFWDSVKMRSSEAEKVHLGSGAFPSRPQLWVYTICAHWLIVGDQKLRPCHCWTPREGSPRTGRECKLTCHLSFKRPHLSLGQMDGGLRFLFFLKR